MRLHARASIVVALALSASCRDEIVPSGGYSGDGGAGSGPSTGGGPSAGGSPGVGGATGGSSACVAPRDCPGAETECALKTCEAGVCGVTFAAVGHVLAAQVEGDCAELVCDGAGDVAANPNLADLPDDGNDCTIDACDGGQPAFAAEAQGTLCSTQGGAVCNDAGNCVECIDGADCPGGLCTALFTCAPASCGDGIQNGSETDIDCGGAACPACATGQECVVDDDCQSGACQDTCQPTCSDGVLNQDESDLDCGGSQCGPCGVGQSCSLDSDCQSGSCSGTCDEYQIKISELRSRGPAGGGDDFVELYNGLDEAVTLPLGLQIAARSDAAASYSVKWTAAGEVIPAHGHILLVGASYSGPVAGDDQLASGLTDKVSLVVRNGSAIVDAFCLYCGATNPFTDVSYTCEGTPFVLVGCTSNNSDRSVERLVGGALGSTVDTGDSALDFHILVPADQQNLGSAPTP